MRACAEPLREAVVNFMNALRSRWQSADTLLCVGLDPDVARLPVGLRGRPDAILRFCRAIVDATAPYVCAFKPQIAYFAAERAEDQLEALIAHIHAQHPGIPVILDAKRGDIGSTAERYAREAFARFSADAVTINPYMGHDSAAPYLEHAEKGVIVLCRTSNAGGDDFQMRDCGGERLFERVARAVAGPWNANGNCALVVGATYPAEIAAVRAIAPTLPLLVPGIGAQGGDVEATVRAGCDAEGAGLMINSSRAVLYADPGEGFAEAAATVARMTRDAINASRRAIF